MENFLEKIVSRKKEEIKGICVPYQERTNSNSFLKALQKPGLSVIGEIKRKSPSKGDINLHLNALSLAKEYESGGAAAVSVLTDEEGFGGTIEDLVTVKKGVEIPVLQKEFIIDPVQISQAVAIGADAVLLIVRALGDRLKEFLDLCNKQGIDALVEVHNQQEIELAMTAGAKIVGINNRDLKSFKVDLSTSEQSVNSIPRECVRVAESGVRSVADARRMYEAGFDAVLVGEALVTSTDPRTMIREMVSDT